jgi:hypothetical protein
VLAALKVTAIVHDELAAIVPPPSGHPPAAPDEIAKSLALARTIDALKGSPARR